MKFTLRLLTLILVTSFTLTVFAGTSEVKECARKEEEQKAKDEALTRSLAGRIAGALICSSALAKVATSNYSILTKTGLDVGLGLAAAPSLFAFVVSGKERAAMTKMAIKVPLIGALGTAVCSDLVMGKVLGGVQYFGIDKIAATLKGLTPSQSAGLFIAFALAHTLANPLLDKLVHKVHQKSEEAYDYAADALS